MELKTSDVGVLVGLFLLDLWELVNMSAFGGVVWWEGEGCYIDRYWTDRWRERERARVIVCTYGLWIRMV